MNTILFENPYSRFPSLEASILNIYSKMCKQDVYKQINLRSQSLIPFVDSAEEEPTHEINGCYPFLLYKQHWLERHQIIDFCNLKFNLDIDLSDVNKNQIKAISEKLKGEMHIINVLNITHFNQRITTFGKSGFI